MTPQPGGWGTTWEVQGSRTPNKKKLVITKKTNRRPKAPTPQDPESKTPGKPKEQKKHGRPKAQGPRTKNMGNKKQDKFWRPKQERGGLESVTFGFCSAPSKVFRFSWEVGCAKFVFCWFSRAVLSFGVLEALGEGIL